MAHLSFLDCLLGRYVAIAVFQLLTFYLSMMLFVSHADIVTNLQKVLAGVQL